MANIRYQVALHNTATNLPKDDAINVLHYEVGAPDTVEGTADDIAAAYTAHLDSVIQGAYSGITIKAYNDATGGDPTMTKSYTAAFTGTGGPSEVALCLSYKGEGSAPVRQRRGRIYLPIVEAQQRPSAFARNRVIAFGQALASAGNATFSTWKMYSPTSGQRIDITDIWVDDAWDTQRRRGLKPTLQQHQSVQ